MAGTKNNAEGLTLNVYDKGGALVYQGNPGAASVAITGLAAGTQVKEGDYQVAFSDGKAVGALSPVPAFTVAQASN